MKRSKRKAETVTQSHREEEEEEATKTRLRRAWRKKKPSTMAPVHESDSRDVFLSVRDEVNAFVIEINHETQWNNGWVNSDV